MFLVNSQFSVGLLSCVHSLNMGNPIGTCSLYVQPNCSTGSWVLVHAPYTHVVTGKFHDDFLSSTHAGQFCLPWSQHKAVGREMRTAGSTSKSCRLSFFDVALLGMYNGLYFHMCTWCAWEVISYACIYAYNNINYRAHCSLKGFIYNTTMQDLHACCRYALHHSEHCHVNSPQRAYAAWPFHRQLRTS